MIKIQSRLFMARNEYLIFKNSFRSFTPKCRTAKMANIEIGNPIKMISKCLKLLIFNVRPDENLSNVLRKLFLLAMFEVVKIERVVALKVDKSSGMSLKKVISSAS